MSATDAGMTITPVFWSPAGFQYSDGYPELIDKFVGDVAAASGASDNVFAVSTEYSSIQYKITAGHPLTDTNDFPSDGCPPKGDGNTACVTDTQVVSELESLLSSGNLPGGLDHIYPVFFPPGVQIQDPGGDYSVAGGDWCGEHNAVPWNDDQLIYAEDAYPPADGGCGGAQAPNGKPFADAAVGILSHEVIEAITDPDGQNLGKRAWNDSSGHEIGDECNQIYGLPLGSTDSADPQRSEYNQVINGDKYYIQEEYSNAAFASLGFAKGCVQNEGTGSDDSGQSARATPLAATSGSASPNPSDTSSDNSDSSDDGQDTTSGADGVIDAGGDGYSLFLYGSPEQLPADSKTATEVDANVTDGNGDPAENDAIHFSVAPVSGAAGSCGKLDHTDVRSDSEGDAHVNYTAGSGDAVCDVVSLEAVGGQSATSTIYQGARRSSAPTLRTTFPDSLTPGVQTTFTTTYTNPSDKAMPNATLDLEIYGGDDNSPNTTDKQLTITYSTNGEAGPFKPVALDGSTGNGDYIAATIGPEEGQTLAPHSTTKLTFHVTPAANITKNATLLDVELYLDQVDPASGSGDTLADSEPVTVAVGTDNGGGGSSSTGLIVGIAAGVGAIIVVATFVIIRRRRRATA